MEHTNLQEGFRDIWLSLLACFFVTKALRLAKYVLRLLGSLRTRGTLIP